MSDIITRTAKLIPYTKRPKQVPSFVTAYSYEPLANEPGATLGNLYVVLEVLISGRASEELADLIIETIGDNYYNQDHASEPLAKFEAAIKATNHELNEHVNHGNAAWIGKLSAIIAIQVDEELHIAQTGSAEAFLYRGKTSTRISVSGPNKPGIPSKTFGSIATGQLEAEDRLLIATPALVHQVPLPKLKSIISHSSPNSAIAEVTQLLRGTSIDRIAALVIEITTPELAALQVRSEQPSEIKLGTPENAFEAAKMAAAPIAQTTVDSSKKVAEAAQLGWTKTKPHARAISLVLVEFLRQVLRSSKGRRITFALIILLTVVLAWLIWQHQASNANAGIFAQYQTVYTEFAKAEKLLNEGNKFDARTTLAKAQDKLKDLQKHQRIIDNKLSSTALPEGQPHSLVGLGNLISDRLDQIDGLVKTEATTLATLPNKNARADHFEILGNKAFLVDAANNNSIFIVNLTTGSVANSKSNTAKLGNVVSTTLSSTNDGIYLLTDKPSVWFYRFDTDVISEQTVSFGGWPKASAISSYASNIYLLADNAIYKHIKNSLSFSPKVIYTTLKDTEAKIPTALAVDGSVYLASSTGLHRYLAGALKQSSPIPDSIQGITNLRSIDNGKLITAVSQTSRRIGVWTVSGENAAFTKQIAPTNVSSLSDAIYDPKSNTFYATSENRLVRFSFQP